MKSETEVRSFHDRYSAEFSNYARSYVIAVFNEQKDDALRFQLVLSQLHGQLIAYRSVLE